MTREELEHIIRASADATNQYEFVIVGSQSILGQVPNPEPVFTMSAEAARHKDREFCMALMEYGYVTPAQALELVDQMPLDNEQKRTLRATIRRWARA